jgi:hypothetical protein
MIRIRIGNQLRQGSKKFSTPAGKKIRTVEEIAAGEKKVEAYKNFAHHSSNNIES